MSTNQPGHPFDSTDGPVQDELVGARWWKFDFHVHTPASDDYGKGPDQAVLRERSPQRWLLDFMRAGIDCVAVTDHNTGAWIDVLKRANAELRKERPEDYRPLHLFPGVEINVHGGIHMLAILDPGKGRSDIDQLLGAAGLPEECTVASVTRKSPVEVAQVIVDRGGLAIPAHIDSERGILVQLDGQSLREVMDSPLIIAAEALNKDCLRRFEPKPAWSLVIGSDAHHPGGSPGDGNIGSGHRYPGSHHTWVKMGSPCIEGLRLALLDGAPLAVLRSDEDVGDPNEHAVHVIESITIDNARYAGRGRPLESRFSPWMSAIVGGRGTGKSTIVEMLRLALDRRDDMPEEIRPDFASFASVPRRRDDAGALTPDTEAVATIRKGDGRFRLRWRADETEASIEEQNPNGEWTRGAGDIRERFPVRILSQKQVLALSRDPDSLLKVIDDSPQVGRVDWDSQHEELEARFVRLGGEVREADSKMKLRSRLLGELSDVKRQIRVFEEGGHRELLAAYGRYGSQLRAFEDRLREMTKVERGVRDLADNLGPSAPREEDFDASREAEADALDLLRKSTAGQRALQLRLDAIANEFADFQRKWSGQVDKSAWDRGRREIEEAYDALQERLQREGVEDVGDFGGLVDRRRVIEKRLAGLDKLEEQRATVGARAVEALADIEARRAELTRRRIAFCEDLLTGNELVRVTLIPFGDDPRSAEDEFRTRLDRRDGRLAKDILDEGRESGILAELYADAPEGPEERIATLTARIGRVKKQVTRITGGEDTPERTRWFHTHVRQLRPDQVAHFELWWPEDRLRVDYRRTARSPFLSIAQGSPGQKSAAILALLLSHGDEPIVLDQPEDDLDNHVIHDLIVRQIRDNKRRRQVIVVTHNPNIVVNGDAEQVIAMDHVGGQCVVVVKGTGSLQEPEVREEVCRVMEGGRRAFEARYRRLVRG